MKKPRLAKKFIEELNKVPIVSVVCERLNISRQTVYRWKDEDAEFRKQFDEALEGGRESINDLAESKLISQINSGNMRAIECWLTNNSRRYYKPKKPIEAEQPEKGSIIFNTILNYKQEKDNEEPPAFPPVSV
jgi:Helix-turn-helix of insertion element transposase